MEDGLGILFIILIVWLILYIILEFNIINNKRIIVKKVFLEIDSIFEKRIGILSKMIDIVKGYDRNQFDEFGSKLYDYSNLYKEYDYNKKIDVNESIENDIKKLLLVSKVYPELKDISKFVKFEKQLITYCNLLIILTFIFIQIIILVWTFKNIEKIL